MDPLGLYIHWPYCAKICPYCDFNVVRSRAIDEARWLQVLTEDLHYWASQRPGKLQSIYIGGGTPSLMPPDLVGRIIEEARTLWSFDPESEITLEANPTDAEQARFQGFRDAGVNRLSLGVQSFNDAALKFLGRNHDAAEAKRAIETAQLIFNRINFDLIYGLPEQTKSQWRQELETGIGFGAGHLSMYQLTIEQGTAFAKSVGRGDWQPISDDQEAILYDIAQEVCEDKGLPAYEVSNHARTGEKSCHNLLYWHYQDYIGIGPGAHGRVTRNGIKVATEGERRIGKYLDGQTPADRYASTLLSNSDQGTEYLSMGLRIENGISLERLREFSGVFIPMPKLDQLRRDGLVIVEGDRLRTTRSGRRLLNALLLELTRHL